MIEPVRARPRVYVVAYRKQDIAFKEAAEKANHGTIQGTVQGRATIGAAARANQRAEGVQGAHTAEVPPTAALAQRVLKELLQ